MNDRWLMLGVACFCRRLLRLLLLLPLAALAAEPTSEPLLRLETGMHTAVIKRIATDAAGRWAVTASDDKTARVWALAAPRRGGQTAGEPAAQPAIVLRPPQDAGNEGKLFAVALSPDAGTVALGGWTGWDWDGKATIYLFDRASDRLLRRIGGLPNVIYHLAWSPDGRWLAASLGAGKGVRVFDATSGDERGSDSDYQDASYSAHFRSDSRRLLTTARDGKLRLYALEAGRWRLLRSAPAAGGKEPYAARYSPDGRRIALGFHDSTVVQVVDGETLAEVARPTTQGVANGNLGRVAWSTDGRVLLAAGRWHEQGKLPLRRWRTADWSPLVDLPLANNTIMDLAPLPDGRVLFAAADPAWGVVSADGRVELRRDPAIAYLRGQYDVFAVSPDARRVRFGYRLRGEDRRIFDLGQRQWLAEDDGAVDEQGDRKADGKADGRADGTAAGAAIKLAVARLDAPGLELRDWKDNTRPTRNGVPLPLKPYEMSRSVAITADGEHFALGTEWSLRFFDRSGKQLWQQPVPGAACAVNVSADGRFVVAGYGDGTIRWHRASDGREVVAFFPHADRQRWIAWTPEGYYDASPDAEDLIGYHLNHGRDNAGEFVSAAQLRETFYQPALIARRLDADGDQRLADLVARRGDVRQILAAGPRPEIELLSPAEASSDGDYLLKVRVRQTGQRGGRLLLRIDEQEIAGRPLKQPLTPGGIIEEPLPGLAPGERSVSAEWVDGRGVASRRVEARLHVAPPADARANEKLHVLAVGVTNYRDGDLRLKYAAADARAIVARFAERSPEHFRGGVVVKALTDDDATVANITRTLGAMTAAARPEDTFVLFLAGHGTTVDEEYYFLPWEMEYENERVLKQQAISQTTLREWQSRLPLRSLLLLDTCRAGTVAALPGRAADDKNALAKLIRLSGRAVIAATAFGRIALEGHEGHGVFSWAVLDAIDHADYDGNQRVDVSDIAMHVRRLVPAITEQKFKYRQVPMQDTPGDPFAVAVPLADGKPR